mgnify:FL=1
MFDSHRGAKAVHEAFIRVGLYSEPSFETDRKALAAAIRAAATVFDRPRRSDAQDCWNDGFQYAQNVCRAELLEIANMLENND